MQSFDVHNTITSNSNELLLVLLSCIIEVDTRDFNICNFFSRMFHISGIVVLSFFVCWAPFHAQRLGYIYFGGLDTSIPGNLILVETFYDVNETLM